mmetsp:Transcript_47901/g.35111  ORF Transcript_47901/g.35111 Transcript_47901/m.35111 type:complete len:144 (-) Transcript_47901:797-1228(-)
MKFGTLQEVADHMVNKLSEDSGLFLQQDFVCDAILPQEDGTFIYYDWLTVPMAKEGYFKDCSHYYLITLGFGDVRSNQVDSVARIDEPARAYFCDNSHPIIRRFNKDACVGEWHITESLDGRYFPHHATPIVEYLSASLKVSP